MNKEEILRYLRTSSHTQDEHLLALIDEAIAQAQAAVQPKSIWRDFDCTVNDDGVIIGTVEFKSRRLAENLQGCKSVAVLGATLGTEADRLLRAAAGESARLAIMQAVLAAMIEEVCDTVQAEIEKTLSCKTKSRYSPGYYDLNITEQKKLFSLLDITKRCGITLTDSYQMIPTKSVTAFAGVYYED